MSVPSKFDAVVIGAGPSGATAAYRLAQKGFRVLLVERGRTPGSKSVYGGRVYVELVKRVYPDLEKDGPIHRWVTRERISLVSGDEMLTLDFEGRGRYSFTCYLSQLTEWMASKAEDAGATLVTEVTVDRLLVRDGVVRGIVAGADTLHADVVVVAEGINRLILERAGIVEPLSPEHVALGVKEVIKLSRETINERFNLGDEEGMAWLLMGSVTQGIPGGAFLYTNNDTVSLGAVLMLSKASERIKQPIYQLVERLRLHPSIKKYVGDGAIVEYSAHLTPEAPLRVRPRKLAGNGWLVAGDAAGFLVNLGYTVRGVDLAVYSGYVAAEAIEKIVGGEPPEVYEEMISKSPIQREIERFSRVYDVMGNTRVFNEYPDVLVGAARALFHIGVSSPKLIEALNSARKGKIGVLTIIKDLYRMVRAL